MIKKIFVLLIGMVLLTGSVSAVCSTTYSGGVFTVPSGHLCTLTKTLYIISSIVFEGGNLTSNGYNILLHRSGGSGDTLRGRNNGHLKMNNSVIQTVTTQNTNCDDYSGDTIGCEDEPCMTDLCAEDPFCCGHGAYGFAIGWWDTICTNEAIGGLGGGECLN